MSPEIADRSVQRYCVCIYYSYPSITNKIFFFTKIAQCRTDIMSDKIKFVRNIMNINFTSYTRFIRYDFVGWFFVSVRSKLISLEDDFDVKRDIALKIKSL